MEKNECEFQNQQSWAPTKTVDLILMFISLLHTQNHGAILNIVVMSCDCS